jgi:Bromodomain/JmjC domain, hydroxylase
MDDIVQTLNSIARDARVKSNSMNQTQAPITTTATPSSVAASSVPSSLSSSAVSPQRMLSSTFHMETAATTPTSIHSDSKTPPVSVVVKASSTSPQLCSVSSTTGANNADVAGTTVPMTAPATATAAAAATATAAATAATKPEPSLAPAASTIRLSISNMPKPSTSTSTTTLPFSVSILKKILSGIRRYKSASLFLHPVTDDIAPGYSKIVKHPMDLGTMRSKLDKNEYTSMESFIQDFDVMIQNCRTYNSPDTQVYKTAAMVESQFQKIVERVQREAAKKAEMKHAAASSDASMTDSSEIKSLSAQLLATADTTPLDDTSEQMLKKVLTAVCHDKQANLFLHPVTDDIAPNYSTMIKNPMDLGTMQDKLNHGKYASVQAFLADFTTMIENCRQYNGAKSPITLTANLFEAQFNKIFERANRHRRAKPTNLNADSQMPQDMQLDNDSATTVVTAANTANISKSKLKPNPKAKNKIKTKIQTKTKTKTNTNGQASVPVKLKLEPIIKKPSIALIKKKLDVLARFEFAWPFKDPVTEASVPGYRTVIKRPMDLQTMRKKAESKSPYATWREFAADINLIVENCKTFNMPNSIVYECAIKFEQFAMAQLKSVLRSKKKSSSSSKLTLKLSSTNSISDDTKAAAAAAAAKSEAEEEYGRIQLNQFHEFVETASDLQINTVEHLVDESSVISAEFVKATQLQVPFITSSMHALDMKVPAASDFSAETACKALGKSYPVPVIDVYKQHTLKDPWTLAEWTEKFNTPPSIREANGDRVYNIISLEVTDTALEQYVHPPRFARELDLFNICWPKKHKSCKSVRLFLLMGMQGSYTDFHIDFGGSSVWYHVVRGEKWFLMLPPTAHNLELYEQHNSGQLDTAAGFLAQHSEQPILQQVKQGETMFIPSGYIHSVFTPADSVVFGGNFLHPYSMREQLMCQAIDERSRLQPAFLFPHFATLYWLYAAHVVHKLRTTAPESSLTANQLKALLTMSNVLLRWPQNPHYTPPVADPRGLSRELSAIVQYVIEHRTFKRKRRLGITAEETSSWQVSMARKKERLESMRESTPKYTLAPSFASIANDSPAISQLDADAAFGVHDWSQEDLFLARQLAGERYKVDSKVRARFLKPAPPCKRPVLRGPSAGITLSLSALSRATARPSVSSTSSAPKHTQSSRMLESSSSSDDENDDQTLEALFGATAAADEDDDGSLNDSGDDDDELFHESEEFHATTDDDFIINDRYGAAASQHRPLKRKRRANAAKAKVRAVTLKISTGIGQSSNNSNGGASSSSSLQLPSQHRAVKPPAKKRVKQGGLTAKQRLMKRISRGKGRGRR